MKYKLLVLIIFMGIFGCKNEDDNVFIVPEDAFKVNFEKIAGGAVMRYVLPSNAGVYGINVRYRDCRGKEVLKVNDYGCDSLVLDGFNEARENVLARVTFVNNQNVESEPIDVTFSTDDSAPYAFFDGADVSSSWGGFQVIYKAPEYVAGFVHVLYLGEDPLTKQSDTLLLKTLPITKGGDTLVFQLQQESAINTIVLRTEDYKGYRVRQKVWENIEALEKKKFSLTSENFFDIANLSVDDEDDKMGIEYLFDGDLRGEKALSSQTDEAYTFLAGPNAIGKPFIIDLGEEIVPASLRIYGMLNIDAYFTMYGYNYYLWEYYYANKLPCKVTVYASNDKNGDDDSWIRVGKFEQDPDTYFKDRWSASCLDETYDYISDPRELEKADPAFMEVFFAYSGQKYRYLKLVINEVFNASMSEIQTSYPNVKNYVTMHELEVYVKK